MNRILVIVFSALLLFAGTATAAAGGDAETKRQPRPSQIMPMADQIIVNDVADTGEHLVAVGARGDLFLSDDGHKWRQIKMADRAMLTRVAFYNKNIGWTVGWDGVIFRTEDGGEHWKLVNFQPEWGRAYFGVLPTGPDSAIVIGGRGRYLVTHDAGAHWTRKKNKAFAAGWNLYDIARIDSHTLMIAGERGFNAISEDNGKTWKMLKPAYNGSFFRVRPYGEHGAVFLGLQGRVYLVKDVRKLPTVDDPSSYTPFQFEPIDPDKLAAMGWHEIDNPVQESLFDGRVYNGHYFIGVGASGTIVTGDLESGQLHQIDSPTAQPLSSVLIRGDQLLLTGRTGFYHRPWQPDNG